MTRIGSIYVEVRGDSTHFKKDMADVRTFAKKSALDVSTTLNNSITTTKASKGISDLSTGLMQLSKSAKAPAGAFKTTSQEISTSLAGVAKSVGLTDKEFQRLNEKLLRNQTYKTAELSMRRIASAAGLSQKEIRNLATQMGYSSKEASKMANNLAGTKGQVFGLQEAVRGLGYAVVAAFGIHEIIAFTDSVRKAGVEIQALQMSYQAILGNAAQAEIEGVKNLSKEFGLSLSALEQSYKGILAAAQGTALEGGNTRKIFMAVAKASAVLGLSADDTSGTLRALSQMISKGNVQAEELRGQLGERLPGAFQMAAEALGVTTQELNKMLQKGEVLAVDLLPKLADVLEKRYGAAAAEAGKTSRAAFENLGTAIEEFKRNLGESGITEFFADLARVATLVVNASAKIMDLAQKPQQEFGAASKTHLKTLDALKKGWGSAAESAGTYATVLKRIALAETYDNDSKRIKALAASYESLGKAAKSAGKDMSDACQAIEDTFDIDAGKWFDGLIEAAEMADIRFEKLNLTDKELRMVVNADDVANTRARLKEITDAHVDAIEARQKAEEKAMEKVEKAESSLFENLEDLTYGLMKNFDDLGDFIVDTLKTAGLKAASAFATTKLVVPMVVQAGAAIGAAWDGVPMASMAGQSGAGNLLLAGNSLWGLYSGTTSSVVQTPLTHRVDWEINSYWRQYD